MKLLILASAAAVALSGFAMANESIIGQDFASAPMLAPVQQRAVTPIKLAMGPTSAPQKPGGVGEGSNETPKPHKKVKHKHTAP
jgi:hypothetical protein